MKNVVFWFSATGNSLWAAKGLAERIPGASLVPLVRALEDPGAAGFSEGDRAIILFPLFYLSYPVIVRRARRSTCGR